MHRLLLLFAVILSCGSTSAPPESPVSTPGAQLGVLLSPAVDPTQDQVLACVYIASGPTLICMTPNEFVVTVEAKKLRDSTIRL